MMAGMCALGLSWLSYPGVAKPFGFLPRAVAFQPFRLRYQNRSFNTFGVVVLGESGSTGFTGGDEWFIPFGILVFVSLRRCQELRTLTGLWSTFNLTVSGDLSAFGCDMPKTKNSRAFNNPGVLLSNL